MKKTLLVGALALGLVACDGLVRMFNIEVSPNALDAYNSAGGTSISLVQSDAITSITTTPIADSAGWYVDTGTCSIFINAQTIDPVNYAFWLTQPITLTYDPASYTCSDLYRCDYVGNMVGSEAEVLYTCVIR